MRMSGYPYGMLWSVFLGGVVFAALASWAWAADAPAGDRDPLPLVLPEPYNGGTPVPYWSKNLEPRDYRDRPPHLAPKGTVLLSQGKPVSSSHAKPLQGKLEQITDDIKKYDKACVVELESGLQWVQIDLGASCDVFAVVVWHSYQDQFVYFDVVVQVSETPDFKEAVTVYNNDLDNSAGKGEGKDKEYVEDYQGRLMPVPQGAKGRYVRLYSSGNTANDMNHYIEVEVFGKPSAG